MSRFRIRHLLREKSARSKKHFTAKDICEAIGLSAELVEQLLSGGECCLSAGDTDKLRTYFGCTSDDLIEQTKRVRFDLKAAFPSTDDLAVAVIRLLAAANDVNYLRGLCLDLENVKRQGFSQEILNCEKNHIHLLMIGCLREGIRVFRDLFRCGEWSRFENELDKEGKEKIQELRKYSDAPDSIYNTWLCNLRDFAAFHYFPKHYKKALENIKQNEGQMLVGPTIAETRFLVADDVREEIFRGQINFDDPSEAERGKTVYDAVHALVMFSSSVLIAYLEYRNISYSVEDV